MIANARQLRLVICTVAISWSIAITVRARAQTGAASVPTPPVTALRPSTVPLDTTVRRAVIDQLGRDEHLIAANIVVTVKDGVVELSGTLPVRPWRQRASHVASVVRGVRAVVNRIRIVAERRQDTAIQRDVRRALRSTAALANMPIDVEVENGVVLLTGSISSWEEQQLAERVASGVPGARFCQNQLTSLGAVARTSAVIKADIETRLDWDPLVAHDQIRVSVRGRNVVLSGVVGSNSRRKRAIDLAWVKGVSSVDASSLVIDASRDKNPNLREATPTDQELLQTIRDVASHWPSVATANLTMSVTGGVVVIHGTVHTLAERDAVEAMTRSVVGVVDVRNELRGPWWKPPAPKLPNRIRTKPKRRRRRAPARQVPTRI